MKTTTNRVKIVCHLRGTKQQYFVARCERSDGSLIAVHTNKNRQRLAKVTAIYS